MRGGERGAVLLEVLVALAILSAAGTTAVQLGGEALTVQWESARREAELRDGYRLLTALTLLTRADLDRRLGRYRVGQLIVEVQRPEQALYRISVGQSRNGQWSEMLVTVVYRPEAPIP